jgi:mRNA-degrading endonuclease YafQ of YafQ-DinJ toxin-antitoxin module
MRMRTRQLSFTDLKKTSKTEGFSQRTRHGHEIRKGLRKLHRPLDPRKPLHLVFRSERARGNWSLKRFKHVEHIRKLIYWLAQKNQVKVLQYANAGTHLHLLVHAKDRDGFKRFTRTLSGLVARLVTGAKKGNPVGKFWDTLFFSRVVEWGRDYFTAQGYVLQNELEADGLVPYKPRKQKVLRP